MRSLSAFISTAIISGILITGCSKSDDTVYTDIKNYINPKPGKYIIYKLDSTVTVNFSAGFATKSYLVKDSVIDTFLDNQNRLSYRIFRFQYDSAAKKWNSINTYYITPGASSYESVEDNIRYIKLVNPASENITWSGNKNAVTSPFYNTVNFSIWQYYYENIKQPFKVDNITYPNTLTVVQYDSTDNAPFKINNFATYDKGYEVYADTIGLIYKDIMSWEYQVDTLRNSYTFEGYGVKMKIQSHN